MFIIKDMLNRNYTFTDSNNRIRTRYQFSKIIHTLIQAWLQATKPDTALPTLSELSMESRLFYLYEKKNIVLKEGDGAHVKALSVVYYA